MTAAAGSRGLDAEVRKRACDVESATLERLGTDG
jgi:hypothetical protein